MGEEESSAHRSPSVNPLSHRRDKQNFHQLWLEKTSVIRSVGHGGLSQT